MIVVLSKPLEPLTCAGLTTSHKCICSQFKSPLSGTIINPERGAGNVGEHWDSFALAYDEFRKLKHLIIMMFVIGTTVIYNTPKYLNWNRMNIFVRELARDKIEKEPSLSNTKLCVEDNIGESIHIHYRNLRLDMSIEDFKTVSEEISNAVEKIENGNY